MRKSRVLETLKKGQIARSIKLNLLDPRVIEIAGMCGFDAVWLDMEHVPTDWTTLENGVRAGKIYNTDFVVRVEKGSYSDYIKPLEMDAAGLIIPHLMSLEEAKQIVKTTRFHPLGLRPMDGGNADGAYCMLDFMKYIKQANENRFICVQIEDIDPLPELEEIAQVEGIDMILFGPGDFSQSLGTPGDQTNPELIKARERVAAVCRKHGKYAATVGNPGNYNSLVDMGYQYINIGADVVGLSQYFGGLLEQCDADRKWEK
ncbi:MAG: aldolase [Spirochaetales bacterium]|nr:aldolase [Spirochaetales bacterium]